jgi:hypothetical protein
MRRSFLRLCTVALSTLVLAGCFHDDDDDDNNAATGNVRIVHASPDAPAVDVLINNQSRLTNVPYKASALLNLAPGVTNIKVNAAGTTNTVIDASPNLLANTRYTVLAINTLAAPIEALVVDDPTTAVANNQVRVRVAHLAPAVPAVDVYVTAPGAALAAPTLGNVPFKQVSNALTVPQGDYRIRITAAGQAAVVYDSGTVPLAGGSDLLIGAVQEAASVSPVSLLVMPRSGNSSSIFDARAQVAVTHASPDTPAVDVLVNNAAVAPLSNVSFPTTSAFLTLDSGSTNVKVRATGATLTPIDTDVTLSPNTFYRAFARGYLSPPAGNANTIGLQAYTVDRTAPPAGNARLRVIHLSPNAPAVDIIAGTARPITNLAYLGASDYLPLPAGNYTFGVAPAGGAAIFTTPSLTLAAGRIYTAVAVGTLPPARNPADQAFTVILLNDN